MALYTQIFNVAAGAVSTTGASVLSLSYTPYTGGGVPGATGTTVATAAATAITVPTLDVNGSVITLANITGDMLADIDLPTSTTSAYMDFALASTSNDLKNLASATSYTVGTVTYSVGVPVNGVMPANTATAMYFSDATSALAAAKDALLAPIDQAGGRSYIDSFIVDGRAYGTGLTAVSPTTTGTIVGTNSARFNTIDDLQQGGDGTTFETNPLCSVGLLKVVGILSMDPAITSMSVSVMTGNISTLVAGSGATTKVYTPVGVQFAADAIDAISGIDGIVVDVPRATAGNFVSLPIDSATLSLLGSISQVPTITLNVAALFSSNAAPQHIALTLAQVDAITSNGIQFNLAKVANGTITGDPVGFRDVVNIRDTAANIAALTQEQASNLQSLQSSFASISSGGQQAGGSGPAPTPHPIEITPVTATGTVDTTPIQLSFATASTLANSGFMISLAANVSTSLTGAFGVVTGDDITRLANAGVDTISFDNTAGITTVVSATGTTSTATPAPAPGTVLAAGTTFTPYAPNSRQVIIEQGDLQGLSKVGVVGLKGNSTVDVVVSVDDSAGGISLPSNIVSKLGIDRITAQDGNLDIGFMDARNALKAGLAFGNAGDSSDATLWVTHSNDLAALKSPLINSFAAKGIDVLAYDATQVALDPQGNPIMDPRSGHVATGLDFEGSASNSKNFIDMVAAATKAGMSVDFSSLLDDRIGQGEGDYASHVVLAASSLAVPGAASNFVTTVNAMGDQGLYIGRAIMDQQSHQQMGDLAIEVHTSGLAASSIEVSDFRASENMDVFANEATAMSQLGSLVKSVAKADAPGMALVDMTSTYDQNANKFGLFDAIQSIEDHFNDAGYNPSVSAIASDMLTFGKAVAGATNLYADFRLSDVDAAFSAEVSHYDDIYNEGDGISSGGTAAVETAVMTNLVKAGFKGMVIDDHVLNDFGAMAMGISIKSSAASEDHEWSDASVVATALNLASDGMGVYNNALSLSQAAQSLDVVYALDASDLSSSVGLSKYVIGADGNGIGEIYSVNGADQFQYYLKDGVSGFRANANTIDKIVISNASNGDMSIDLSEFGVNQNNFSSMIAQAGNKEDTFMLHANNGKYISIQILGLTDHNQFTAADIRELPVHGADTIIG